MPASLANQPLRASLTVMPLRKLKPREWLRIGLGLIALFLASVLVALLFPNQVLCVDSGPSHADAIVVLGGGSFERPLCAVELFRQNAAPHIILTGFGDNDSNRRVLLKAGVPAAAID